MLDSIYHMTLRLFCNLISGVKIVIMYASLLWTPIYSVAKICKRLAVHGVISLPDRDVI